MVAKRVKYVIYTAHAEGLTPEEIAWKCME